MAAADLCGFVCESPCAAGLLPNRSIGLLGAEAFLLVLTTYCYKLRELQRLSSNGRSSSAAGVVFFEDGCDWRAR